MVKNLILFTDTYPYGVGEQFIEEELKRLEAYFSNITIVPSMLKKTKRRYIPKNAICELELAKRASYTRVGLEAIYFSPLYPELLNRIKIGLHILEYVKISYFSGTANLTQRWLSKYIKREKIDLDNTIFYTYWLNATTFGIGCLKKEYPNLKLVSRCHGYDLYEERYNPPYIPFQKETLNDLDRLFLISDHGLRYITKKYPLITSICTVAKLGVIGVDSLYLSKASDDGIFRVVSCSLALPVKRLDLLLRGVAKLAESEPSQIFEWYHLGDGRELKRLKIEASKIHISSLKIHFLGQIAHNEVLDFYMHNPIDVFINVSALEGVPVSIMEAQSYGIPVIATAVGGTTEIVSNLNGKLLSPNPTPEEIAESIGSFLKDKSSTVSKRIESRINWEINYNAVTNYKAFIKALQECFKN